MRQLRFWALSALAGLTACAGSAAPPPPVPQLAPDHLVARIYLIGDAGDPRIGSEPVLQALSHDLRAQTAEPVVVFLGDNVYPRGMPAADDSGRAEAERRLLAQIQTVQNAGAKAYFVLGNHDWDRFGADGWNAALRQERYIDSVGKGFATLKPGGGCPGPSTIDIGSRVRLLLLDTQWWLHSGPKPEGAGSSCPTRSEPEVIDSVRAALRNAGSRLIIVAAHHPLSSGGVHGGNFGWEDHIFPLRLVSPILWIPLPYIGSLYPAARQNGVSSQDMSSRAYQRLIAAFSSAFRDVPPALYAAGHEHNLQVIAGGAGRLELVSGGGIYGHTGRAVRIRGSLFARNASGFARLDVPSTGRARLAVLEVSPAGESHEVFSTWVE